MEAYAYTASLAGTLFALFVSPGPNNALVMHAGLNGSYVRALPLITGIIFGLGVIFSATSLFLTSLIPSESVIWMVLELIASIILLYFAYLIATSKPADMESGEGNVKRIGFFKAAVFQIVNPKTWAVALTVSVGYGDAASSPLASSLIIVGVACPLAFCTGTIWTLGGRALSAALRDPKAVAWVNRGLGALLAVTAVVMVAT